MILENLRIDSPKEYIPEMRYVEPEISSSGGTDMSYKSQEAENSQRRLKRL